MDDKVKKSQVYKSLFLGRFEFALLEKEAFKLDSFLLLSVGLMI